MARLKQPRRHASPSALGPRDVASPPKRSTEIVLAAVAGLVVVLSVTHMIFETDFWQHLAVGRAIWTTGAVPTTQIWSWPTYGVVDTTSSYSWLFRFLIYPVWSAGGVLGLFGWRWITTLITFALLWKTARTLGAREPAVSVVLILCALVYRQRTQVRPETLAAILLAALLLLLERRRGGSRDHPLWLVGILWLWANTHVSYYLGFVVLVAHALNDVLQPRTVGGRARSKSLWPVCLASAAACFVNPYGWRALWQPLQYFFVLRHEDIYRNIGETRALDWAWNARNGFPLVLLAWMTLQLWRARRGRFDPVESGLFVVSTAQALAAGRFLGFWALFAGPYLARDLADWLRARKWNQTHARGAAIAGVVGCGLLVTVELTRPDLPFGVGLVPGSYPRPALDFMAREDIRGRIFNSFHFGGYLLWRFWPDRSRLPFMDIHQSGTAAERYMYTYARARRDGWLAVKERYQPDIVLARRLRIRGDSLTDFVDADTAWALVFADDLAALYVRRAQVSSGMLDRNAYALVPGGVARLRLIQERHGDHAFRQALRAELDRMIAASPLNSIASSFRGTVNLADGRLDEAETDLERAHEVDPLVPHYHLQRGRIAMLRRDTTRALAAYEKQRRIEASAGLDMTVAQLHQRLGHRREAIRTYRRLLGTEAYAAEARDSLRSLGVGIPGHRPG